MKYTLPINDKNSKIKFIIIAGLLLIETVLFLITYLSIPVMDISQFLKDIFLWPLLATVYAIYAPILLLILVFVFGVIIFFIFKFFDSLFENGFIYKASFVSLLLVGIGLIMNIYVNRIFLLPGQDMPSYNDETNDWKTYKSTQYGFEIKYPKDWLFEEQYPSELGFFQAGTPKLFEADKYHFPAIKFVRRENGNVDYYIRTEMKKQKYKLDDGIEIIKFIPTTKESISNAIIYVDDKVYGVDVNDTVFGQPSKDLSNRDVFDKMLSTIKICNGQECKMDTLILEENYAPKKYQTNFNQAEYSLNWGIATIISDWYRTNKSYENFKENGVNMEKVAKALKKVEDWYGIKLDHIVYTDKDSFVVKVKSKDNNTDFKCFDTFKNSSNAAIKLSDDNFEKKTGCLGSPLENFTSEFNQGVESFDDWFQKKLDDPIQI